MVNSPITPDELVVRVSRSHARLLELVDRLDDREKDSPSALPDWTRGHVLQHLADNARAFERQALAAAQGELVDMYDGGQAERDQSIDQGAARPVADLREDLKLAQQALVDTWGRLTAADWQRTVRFRHARVLDTALARWREAEIHAVDLAVGCRPATGRGNSPCTPWTSCPLAPPSVRGWRCGPRTNRSPGCWVRARRSRSPGRCVTSRPGWPGAAPMHAWRRPGPPCRNWDPGPLTPRSDVRAAHLPARADAPPDGPAVPGGGLRRSGV
ncbi:maleylpyruvate isomerase N-terminal domain-containing protein [Streptomyces alboflavus]|uniref:maleylpyruvate isomerase N-terminal domain-containing protein n=1 Tax=Streptomyces alboflavus TaxID=67267 RepID=UPI001EED735B|nr:maleylpyruvate isomerase N-terminal domain-containing protein [Streptomyces alboflavus]